MSIRAALRRKGWLSTAGWGICFGWIALWVGVPSGCGYQPLSKVGQSGRCATSGLFENQTSYAGLTTALHQSFRRELHKMGIDLCATAGSGESRHRIGPSAEVEIRVFSISENISAISLVQERETPVGQVWKMSALVRIRLMEDSSAGAEEGQFGPEVITVAVDALVPPNAADEPLWASQVQQQLVEKMTHEVAKLLVMLDQ